jgi:putative hydrolase of the HAD superfamily
VTDFAAVIFDFGGVLTTPPGNGMRDYCAQNGIPWEAFRTQFLSHESAWSRFEANALTHAEFIASFESEGSTLGFTVDGAGFLSTFFEAMALRPEMVAVVREIRRHHKVGCITNNVRVETRQRLIVFEDLFDVVVESSKVGMRKPNPAIYLHACELLGVTPQQAIFLDDFGVNLKAARELGMATIKVDESLSAIDELERLLGIPLPRTGEGQAVAG